MEAKRFLSPLWVGVTPGPSSAANSGTAAPSALRTAPPRARTARGRLGLRAARGLLGGWGLPLVSMIFLPLCWSGCKYSIKQIHIKHKISTLPHEASWTVKVMLFQANGNVGCIIFILLCWGQNGNEHEVKCSTFSLNTRKYFYSVKVTEHCYRLLKFWSFPSWRYWKPSDVDLGSSLQVAVLEHGVGPGDIQRCLPASAILWVHKVIRWELEQISWARSILNQR